ncbi:hypothetical protein FC13_GL002571 [Lacticaseibacillus casei DSM 20011 = JCM 1134 = ATCC 393]|nr:hypothetical protein FC13_GL002571 [Lacticaseibacillus casei DSM 20011 = JCM 1134 = ATCC 393]
MSKEFDIKGAIIMKKMDEMELKFRDQSIRYSWAFMIFTLFIYEFFHVMHYGKFDFISVVVNVAVGVQIASFLWLKHRADKTDKEPGRVLIGTIVIVVVVLTLGMIGLMFHGK